MEDVVWAGLVLHEYEVPPLAASVVVLAWQYALIELGVTESEAVSEDPTCIAVEEVLEHPLELPTVTLYPVLMVGETMIELPDDPVLQ